MSTYTQTAVHVVFATKDRQPVLLAEGRRELFAYMHGILQRRTCHTHRIGGVADHVHLLFNIHPDMNLSALVRDIKTSTSVWMRAGTLFPGFTKWQEGYGAFHVSASHRDALVRYIANQEAHHQTESSKMELERLLRENGVEYDSRYMAQAFAPFGDGGLGCSVPRVRFAHPGLP